MHVMLARTRNQYQTGHGYVAFLRLLASFLLVAIVVRSTAEMLGADTAHRTRQIVPLVHLHVSNGGYHLASAGLGADAPPKANAC